MASTLFIIIVVMFSAVRPSVVINIYDDDVTGHTVKSVNKKTLQACDPLQCDQQCQSAGFAAGTCFGDSCQCTGMLHNKDNAVKVNRKILRNCDPLQCDQQCQSAGFAAGTCFGDSCQCTGMLHKKEKETHSGNIAKCEESSCQTSCRLMNYLTGYCYNGSCICYWPRSHIYE